MGPSPSSDCRRLCCNEHVEWTAIVLAGGRGVRLGTPKSQIVLDGALLIQGIIEQLSVPVIVAGEAPAGVPAVAESPPDGGPAAGLAAALARVDTPAIGLLAADMPFAAPLLPRLVGELAGCTPDVDAVLSFDGRAQPLCAAYRTQGLRRVLADKGTATGLAMHALLDGLSIRHLEVESELLLDIDTPEDLARAELRRGAAP